MTDILFFLLFILVAYFAIRLMRRMLVELDDSAWNLAQGPLTSAIHEALQEKDMTLYELRKWLKQNHPAMPKLYDQFVTRAVDSWIYTGAVVRYSKLDQEKNREVPYLRWVNKEAAR